MIEHPFEFSLCNNHSRNKFNIPYYKRVFRVGRSNHTARNNPHPRLVNHFYGVQNMIICRVLNPSLSKEIQCLDFPVNNDTGLNPTNTLTGLQICRYRNKPSREKVTFQLGIVPTQETWRRELRAITESIIEPVPKENIELKKPLISLIECHPYPICRPVTVVPKRRVLPKTLDNIFDREKLKTPKLCYPPVRMLSSDRSNMDSKHLGEYESQVFGLLSQILQATNEEDVKTWLTVASDREKASIMDLLQSAFEFNSRFRKEDIDSYDHKEKNDFLYPNEIEERSVNLCRLIINSDCDQKIPTILSRSKTISSKIRPQTSYSTKSPYLDNEFKSEPQTSHVTLRYQTSFKYRPESSEKDSIFEDNLS